VEELEHRLRQCTRRRLDEARSHLKAAARGLPRPEDLVALPRQRFDAAEKRLARALMANTQAHGRRLTAVAPRLQPRLLAVRIDREAVRLERVASRTAEALRRGTGQRRLRLEKVASRLSPSALASRLARSAERFDGIARRGAQAYAAVLWRQRQGLEGLGQMLGSLSYRSVLGRGYAVVRDGSGRAIRSTSQLPRGAHIEIEVADGRAAATVTGPAPEAGPEPAPARPTATARSEPVRTRPASRRRSDDQGSLF
jgi:exodeoxyribonuclease VII large subunit